MMENPKFTIIRSKDGRCRFNLRAKNGEIVLRSKGYTTKHNCESRIQSVKTNAPYGSRYNVCEAANGQCYFDLVALDGEIIGTGENYITRPAMEHGIAVVQAIAPTAPVEDQT